MSIRYFGLDAFRAAIDGCLDLAEHAEGLMREHPELELGAPASLGVVTFRRHPVGIDDEARLEQLNTASSPASSATVTCSCPPPASAAGWWYGYASSTTPPAPRWSSVRSSWWPRCRCDADRAAGRLAPARPRCEAGWLSRPQLDVRGLRSLPLFASLEDDQAEQVLARLRERTAAAGEEVVGQWQAGRDLYVVLDGRGLGARGRRRAGHARRR